MAQYTMTVYELMQNNFDFGLDKYTIFDEEYRPLLNAAILDFYKWHEIAYQNPALWRDRLSAKLDLIMRNKYNDLYNVKKTEFNPLFNIDLTETFEHNISSTGKDKGTSKVDSSNEGMTLGSTFPSDEFQENDLTSNLYVDSASRSNGKAGEVGENQNENESSMIEKYTRTNKGSSAGLPFSKAMIQFQDYIKKYQLDNMVIQELHDLFMGLW